MERREFDFGQLQRDVPSLLSEEVRREHASTPCYYHVTSLEMLSSIAQHGLWPSRLVQQKIARGQLPKTNLGFFYGSFGEETSCLPDNVCLTDDLDVGVHWVKDVMHHSRLDEGVYQTAFAVISVSREIEKLPNFMSNSTVCATISDPLEGEVGVTGIIPPEYLLCAEREFYRG